MRYKTIAVDTQTGEYGIFDSVQAAATLLSQEGIGKGSLDSITNYITRIARKGGKVYGFRWVRSPLKDGEVAATELAESWSKYYACKALMGKLRDAKKIDIFTELKEALEGIDLNEEGTEEDEG